MARKLHFLLLLLVMAALVSSCGLVEIRHGETPLNERDPNYVYTTIGGKSKVVIYDANGKPVGYLQKD